AAPDGTVLACQFGVGGGFYAKLWRVIALPRSGDVAVNKEAVQRLREPAAWVLLASAGVQLLAGIVSLLAQDGPFTLSALLETRDGIFFQVEIVGLLVLAVVLTTWGGQATPQAKNITIGSLAVLAGVALFGIVCWLGGMLAESQSADAIAKLSAFLVGAG